MCVILYSSRTPPATCLHFIKEILHEILNYCLLQFGQTYTVWFTFTPFLFSVLDTGRPTWSVYLGNILHRNKPCIYCIKITLIIVMAN